MVIDPVMSWNTFLGGSGEGDCDDNGYAIAVDSSGNVYVAGYSSESWGTPVRAFSGGSYDGFVAKLDSSGNLLWNTFLGSNGADIVFSIAVDSSGSNVYASGESNATWGLPLRSFTTEGSHDEDAFAAKLNAGNGSLSWNTFLGVNVALADYNGEYDMVQYFCGIALDVAGMSISVATAMPPGRVVRRRYGLIYPVMVKISLRPSLTVAVASSGIPSWAAPVLTEAAQSR